MNLLNAAGRRAAGRIADLSQEPGTDERKLRAAILDELRTAITFDAYAWLLTDPSTEVGTAPLAEVPDLHDLPRLIASKYLTTVNRWTALPAGRSATLHEATGGALERSRLWREVLSQYGVTDVVSMSFRDRYGLWGFLDLWRRDGATPVFAPADRRLLDSVHQQTTGALRSVVAATFATAAISEATGPSVLLLTDELAPLGQTTDVEGRLRDLLPTPADRSPVPAAALNVAAALLAREQGIAESPAAASAYLGHGRWTTVSASRLALAAGLGPAPISVSIEPMGSGERVDLFSLAIGLTVRESAILHHLAQGNDTATLARRLSISVLTVQDHVAAIHRKAKTRHRAELLARALGS
jgi:DNA-binding CsgD family transcriptional regulator